MSIVVEEADETVFWLELLADTGIVRHEKLSLLLKEANELLAICTASLRTAKHNRG
jgi:four helix bundle protein